jgi:peptidyl-tRNA hydrolase
MGKIKQVIVMRYKYPNPSGGTMSPRTGKIAAQASHASMSFITKRLQQFWKSKDTPRQNRKYILAILMIAFVLIYLNFRFAWALDPIISLAALSALGVLSWQSNAPAKEIPVTTAMESWINGSFAKVCLRVDTEEELFEVHKKALEAGLEVHLIQDSGLTEFHTPTFTCLAIGPDHSENIDPVTKHLKLL